MVNTALYPLLDLSDPSQMPPSQQSTQDVRIPAGLRCGALRRVAILDACNLMHRCARYNIAGENCRGRRQERRADGPPPNGLGVLTAVHTLISAGFDVHLHIPQSFERNPRWGYVANSYVLKFLEPLCVLTKIYDESHDDLVLLEAALTFGGFIITNDRFRDHDEVCPRLRGLIKNRVVRFHMNTLQVNTRAIATRQGRYFTGFELTLEPNTEGALLAIPDDPTYPTVLHHRLKRSQQRLTGIRRELDTMADYLQQEVCLQQNLAPPKLAYFDPTRETLPSTYDQFRRKAFQEQEAESM